MNDRKSKIDPEVLDDTLAGLGWAADIMQNERGALRRYRGNRFVRAVLWKLHFQLRIVIWLARAVSMKIGKIAGTLGGLFLLLGMAFILGGAVLAVVFGVLMWLVE